MQIMRRQDPGLTLQWDSENLNAVDNKHISSRTPSKWAVKKTQRQVSKRAKVQPWMTKDWFHNFFMSACWADIDSQDGSGLLASQRPCDFSRVPQKRCTHDPKKNCYKQLRHSRRHNPITRRPKTWFVLFCFFVHKLSETDGRENLNAPRHHFPLGCRKIFANS